MPYCSNCHNECELTVNDTGIGAYEYWGSKGFDQCLEVVSNCCEADAFDCQEIEEMEDGTVEYRYSKPSEMPEPDYDTEPDWRIDDAVDYAYDPLK